MNVLVVDGYNIIGAWDELQRLKRTSIGQARDRLIEMLAEYQAYSGMRVIVVFDAYYVKGIETKLKEYQVEIIYTKESETADECIERIVKGLKNVINQVYVATSDYAEQRTIFGRGALRKSARELYIELTDIGREIEAQIEKHQKVQPQIKIPLKQEVLEKFEKWRRGDK
ncbi:NYN domain-containing protein [Lentibacillus sp.]|jgi:predicted RNA-binding protein with PIN domain|uniref:NYN domain-containing protein n=1 Tax=Lentibacillus sp. TaxID=1925746 RepID=UPI002B4AFC0B|nr:NYN domain-containing protein [Lentibacillus sp.]HLS08850.1 NYN domain-containing protein [Lentibacillus sp.]